MKLRLHEDEIAIDRGLVRRLVDRQFPEHARLPLSRLGASGSTNVLFRLGDDLLVRLPRQPGGSSSIDKEFDWLPTIGSRLPVAVPDMVARGEPGCGFTERWAIVRWLEGEMPRVFSSTVPAQPDRSLLAADLADVIVALRGIDVSEAAATDPRLRPYRGRPLAELDPVDTKVRTRMAPEGSEWRVLGYAEAAALPLTAITAWEMLFDRLDVRRPTPQGGDLILVIGGAGGVGSITIQLLRALTDLTVVATASRPETQDWVRACGAHHVVNHREPLAPQVAALGIGAPGFVFSTTQTDQHMADIVELIAPQGRFGLIDDPAELDIRPFKPKAVSTHWEFMFARPVFGTPDMAEQGALLNEVAALVDEGRVRSTLTEVAGRIDAATLRAAHARIESGTARGKIVLEGW